MHAAGDEAGEVSHIDHEGSSDFIGNGAHAGEVELARIGASAAYDDLWLLALRGGFEFVIVNGFGVFANLVADDAVEFAREVELVAVGEMAAVGEIEAQDAVAWIEQRHVGGGVGLGAGVGLDVDVIGVKQAFGAGSGEVFYDVGVFAAA